MKSQFRRGLLCFGLSAGLCLGSSCGALGGKGGGGGKNITDPVTGLTATGGNAQITLNWNAYAGATSYAVLRSATSGGPFTYIDISSFEPPITTTSYTDAGIPNGTTYYYEVVADGSWGVSNPSNPASATAAGPSTSIAVTVDVLANQHSLSRYVYGGAFPEKLATPVNAQSTALNVDLTAVRWGGNASSTYNWQLGTSNAASDNFFEDLTFCGVGGLPTNSPCAESDSVQFIKDADTAQTAPVMTMPMLPWAAQGPASNGNGHWSFSVARDGAQCHTDPHNSDAGDGVALTSNCNTLPAYLAASSTDINDAYVPLLDDHSQTCPSGTSCVYRSDWATALAAAFAGNSFFPHFYEMDNEMDMWGVTHRDIHPNPSGYDELASVYLTEANKLKGWDPQAVRLGPVSCCWWLYWNGANSNDKAAHAGEDFLPWWLNQIYWQDQISGARSLDVFDIHAFPDATTTDSKGNPLPKAQLQALAGSIFRDYWDPTFVSPSTTINQQSATSIQPNKTIPFRIPRMRALANTIYPGTPLAITEWGAAFAGESDFSTALADADAYGIMGRENIYVASRWNAPNPANPNYWALKLYTDYDGLDDAFGFIAVSDTHNGDPNLFSSYAALGGFSVNQPNIMVINKDPQNSAQVQFTLKNFNPTTYQSYTLASPSPTVITGSAQQPWSAVQYFPPYSITLLAVSGSIPSAGPGFSLNPDTIMVPAGGTVTLEATGNGNVTLSSAVFDAFEGAAACSGSIVLTNPTITASQPAQLTVNAGNTQGFCHFTVTESSGSLTEGGWIIVGNPAAGLTATGGNHQTGMHGTTLPLALAVSLAPGSSGGANPASGASILFSTNAGTVSNGTTSGSKVIATTNSSGVASVTLTLPSAAEAVTVTAEGPYGLGHPTVTFTETSQ
ncbi:MAG TPA: glycoside hydrolase family 44 protein [Candidatus Dormibacteraeota bacterium]|nr:glycoside hydrolase family 44 protein [Candidatus Dormibacteraeota bacterium]